MEQQQPDVIIGNPQTQQISAKEFAAKYKSKREVYNFLSVDVGVYLPAYGKWPSSDTHLTRSISSRVNLDLFPERPRREQEEE